MSYAEFSAANIEPRANGSDGRRSVPGEDRLAARADRERDSSPTSHARDVALTACPSSHGSANLFGAGAAFGSRSSHAVFTVRAAMGSNSIGGDLPTAVDHACAKGAEAPASEQLASAGDEFARRRSTTQSTFTLQRRRCVRIPSAHTRRPRSGGFALAARSQRKRNQERTYVSGDRDNARTGDGRRSFERQFVRRSATCGSSAARSCAALWRAAAAGHLHTGIGVPWRRGGPFLRQHLELDTIWIRSTIGYATPACPDELLYTYPGR